MKNHENEGRQMPFTPFHWVFVFLFVVLLSLDPLTLFVTAVIQDIEPFSILFLLNSKTLPLHGIIHSLTLAVPIGLFCAYIVNSIYAYLHKQWSPTLKHEFNITLSSISLKNSLVAGLVGTISHTLLDALLYEELPLFWPLEGNIVYGLFSIDSYAVCGLALIVGIVVLLFKLILRS